MKTILVSQFNELFTNSDVTIIIFFFNIILDYISLVRVILTFMSIFYQYKKMYIPTKFDKVILTNLVFDDPSSTKM